MAYTVKSGDTLYQLAKNFGTTVSALQQANNISDPRKMRAGSTLTIPGQTSGGNASSGAAYSSSASPSGLAYSSSDPRTSGLAYMSTTPGAAALTAGEAAKLNAGGPAGAVQYHAGMTPIGRYYHTDMQGNVTATGWGDPNYKWASSDGMLYQDWLKEQERQAREAAEYRPTPTTQATEKQPEQEAPAKKPTDAEVQRYRNQMDKILYG